MIDELKEMLVESLVLYHRDYRVIAWYAIVLVCSLIIVCFLSVGLLGFDPRYERPEPGTDPKNESLSFLR